MAGVFKAYDVRGVYLKELRESLARDIGAAFATMFPGSIVVGGDVRQSTPSLKAAFIEGLRSAGANVVDIGFATTPLVLFATKTLGAAGGANITASHNPKEYNGLKLNDGAGIPLSYETGISKIEALVKERKFAAGKRGGLTQRDVLPEYIKFMEGHLPKGRLRGWRIVVDAGNSVGGLINPAVLQALGAEVIQLYCEPDGTFPNHEPNPENAENMRDLQAKVREVRANLGVAYDGDADRVGFVDERGEIVAVNKIFCLFVRDVLAKRGGGKIVYDVECSKLVDDVIRAAGGVPIVSKTGHTYITQRMISEKADFAGEKSGHYYFAETQGIDDGLFATVRALTILTESKKPLSEATADFKLYEAAYRRIPVPEERKFDMVQQIKEHWSADGLKPITLDGARVNFPKGWALVRASNTEPKLSVTYEASTKEEFGKIERIVDETLKEVGAI